MRFADPVIKRCGLCSGFIEEKKVMSGNTLGAKYWTDGKVEAPKLSVMPKWVRCPHCQALSWLEELKVATKLDKIRFKKQLRNTKAYCKPSQQDFFKTLSLPESDPSKEKYLRVRAWWTGNDNRRDTEIMSTLSLAEQTNLHALAPTLDLNGIYDRIMAAEIKRELGQYEEALNLLMDVLNERSAIAVSTIIALARKQDSYVREIEQNDS